METKTYSILVSVLCVHESNYPISCICIFWIWIKHIEDNYANVDSKRQHYRSTCKANKGTFMLIYWMRLFCTKVHKAMLHGKTTGYGVHIYHVKSYPRISLKDYLNILIETCNHLVFILKIWLWFGSKAVQSMWGVVRKECRYNESSLPVYTHWIDNFMLVKDVRAFVPCTCKTYSKWPKNSILVYVFLCIGNALKNRVLRLCIVCSLQLSALLSFSIK